MADAIVVLNAGSSSLKFSVYLEGKEDCELLLRGQIEALLRAPRFVAYDAQRNTISQHVWKHGTRLGHHDAIQYLFNWIRSGQLAEHRVNAIGHRVVHGGVDFTEAVLVDDAVLAQLDKLTPLAPLHQPHNLSAIRAVATDAPDLAQVACFDTSFHRGHPAVECTFALPRQLTEMGIRRYGFHGLSYEYIASRLPDVDPKAAEGRTVVAHLGSGASMCALHNCRSVATTMSFTALDGLPMGTRSGSLDPGVLLHLMDQHGMDARRLERLLYRESGLLGVSGISNDMRVLLQSDDPRAAEAVDLFVYRIGRELGSLAAALCGLDALVFTAGIGENAAAIRARVCQAASWLGVELDEERNEAGGPLISRPGSAVSAWVIPTNEGLMIARHTRRVLANTRQDD
jgi:acetate kinase